MFQVGILLAVQVSAVLSLGSQFQHRTSWREGVHADPGEPLYLTPYIKSGQTEKGSYDKILDD